MSEKDSQNFRIFNAPEPTIISDAALHAVADSLARRMNAKKQEGDASQAKKLPTKAAPTRLGSGNSPYKFGLVPMILAAG